MKKKTLEHIIKSTYITGESSEELWKVLLNLTELIYKERYHMNHEGRQIPDA